VERAPALECPGSSRPTLVLYDQHFVTLLGHVVC
jgi:hypothetical protein